MISVLIWDAGGTLFDTYPALAEACRRALESFQREVAAEEILPLLRQGTDDTISHLAQTYGVDETELRGRMRAAYEEIGPQHQPPFEGVREVCAYARERGGLNYIVTHRSKASLLALLEAHGMLGYFSGWITKDDPFPRKPDPTSIVALIERHALDPATCLVIGDRCLDIQAGEEAGAATCLFGNEPCGVEPDVRVTSFRDLLCWLRKRGGELL